MSVGDLVLKWIIIAKGLYKVLKKKRVKEFLNKLLENINILNIYIKEMEKYSIVGASVAFIIQGKLKKLREKKSLFSSFDEYVDIKQLDLGHMNRLNIR